MDGTQIRKIILLLYVSYRPQCTLNFYQLDYVIANYEWLTAYKNKKVSDTKYKNCKAQLARAKYNSDATTTKKETDSKN